MTVEYVMSLTQQLLAEALWTSLPILAAGMTVGVLVAVFQAATQIQEASLAFVPKLVGMGIALVVFGPWIMERLIAFTSLMLDSAAAVGGG